MYLHLGKDVVVAHRDIVAVCDLDRARARLKADRIERAYADGTKVRVYADYKEVCAQADVDAQVRGLATVIANPFAAMQASDRIRPRQLAQDAPMLLIATGLALRSFE